jgi:hypothetical protein
VLERMWKSMTLFTVGGSVKWACLYGKSSKSYT